MLEPSLKIRSWLAWLTLSLLLCAFILPTRAEVVNFKELLPFMDIKIPGWAMVGKPCGTTIRQGKVMMSEARASFRSGDMTLEVIIMDFLGKPIPFLKVEQMEMESGEEIVHNIEVQGFRALESYRQHDKQGELDISVADRFWVKIEAEGVDDLEALKTAAQQMDLRRLACLAK